MIRPCANAPVPPAPMPSPFLDESFHVRWSSLETEAVESDITSALERAGEELDRIINQDRGRLGFESVMLAQEEALRPLNEAWGLVTHLDAVCNSPALREAHNRMLPQISSS